MKRIVGVRFKEAGRMYYFNPGELPIQEDDGVIVETSRGIEYGEVALTPRDLPDEQIVAPLKDVVRVATEEDRETHVTNLRLEKEAFDICQAKVSEHTLDMKLVDVEYTFNGSKITFFFTSDGRVDFRELVKDLAHIFKTRIELRQIGVRDEAKMLGGLGSCGRPVCCKTFLADFQPVSIKMAKEQKLSLSPTKISGLCGRLMCCLKYEQDAYESMRKLMPKLNKEVITADGRGLVLDNNVITERTRVRITLPDGTLDVREYHFNDVRKPGLPEEDASIQAELLQAAQKKAVRTHVPVEEEEFRFVTGALPEERPAAGEDKGRADKPGDPNPQESEKQKKQPQKRKSRRRPIGLGQSGGAPSEGPAGQAGIGSPSQKERQNTPRQGDSPRENGGGMKQPQKDRQPEKRPVGNGPKAIGGPKTTDQGGKTTRRSRRGGRNHRRKPGAEGSFSESGANAGQRGETPQT